MNITKLTFLLRRKLRNSLHKETYQRSALTGIYSFEYILFIYQQHHRIGKAGDRTKK